MATNPTLAAPAPAPIDPAPKSPDLVKKTPLKTPKEIKLEKDVSQLQDKLTQLEGMVGGIQNWLADLFPGGKKSAAVKSDPALPTPADSGNDLDTFISGKA